MQEIPVGLDHQVMQELVVLVVMVDLGVLVATLLPPIMIREPPDLEALVGLAELMVIPVLMAPTPARALLEGLIQPHLHFAAELVVVVV
jgi:methylglyoxal synthase